LNKEPLLLGVDVGTSRIKVGAFHLDGRLAALRAANYPLAFDGATNAAEQDAASWWRITADALRETTAEVGSSRLAAICVGGQGPTVVAMDEALSPVSPALTWMDRRATAEAGLLSDRLRPALAAHAFLPKVMWLKSQRPGSYSAARWFCQSWDFVAAQLTGKPIVSTSAGIAPWTDDWLTAAELDKQKFPEMRRMGERIGQVTTEAGRATGLPPGLPVVGGISDYFEGIIGSAALRLGLACDNGGTSQSFNVCWDRPLQVDGVFCIPSFGEGQWYVGGPVSTTGKALAWWSQEVLDCGADDWSLLEAAHAVPSGSEGLIFLPYLAGERAPLWDANARGVFFGLTLHHRRAHMTRAILEAVAYALCHLIEHIENAGAQVQEIHACGGQAKSDLWCQIKADATGIGVSVPEVTDAAVLGAAIIAAVGIGVFDDYAQAAARMVRTRAVATPNAENHTRYRELYAVYRELYQAAQSLYVRLNPIH
jgi:xylulokinase